MKNTKNESGYALLMVIMLVLLFTTLGMGLLAMNINASKQFNNKEEQVQARHQAEMGLLHYQAEVKKKVEEYKFTRSTGEKKDAALARSRTELCQQIKEVELPKIMGDNGEYTISDRVIDGCSENATGEIKISLQSTGESTNGVEKIVDGSIEMRPPVMEVDNEVPLEPEIPENNDSDDDEDAGYTKMDGPFVIRDENLEFNTLVINTSPTDTHSDKKDRGQTLQFGSGKGEYLTINKDLYVGGTIHSQNHSCIYVRGNMTVTGNLYFNTQSSIIVLGNAYFGGVIDLHTNADLYVAGNTYIGTNKDLTNIYRNNINFQDKCGNLPDWPNTEPNEYRWETNDELNPYYH
ncbi:hypothetical protein DHX103_14840 [Planococcus sp. X10-3]|uniref:hypothetical protein n=1 Tax=Planococcus sp. X10-3 TaxID=3061240 RepID=UPI003BAE8E19